MPGCKDYADNFVGHVTPLHMTDLPALCALDEDLMRKRLALYNDGTAVALVPDYKTIGTSSSSANRFDRLIAD